MAKTVFDVLEEKIAAQQRNFEEHLSSGGAKDFPEYRDTCGVIRGLAIARRELSDLLRVYKEQNDDD
jgi:hypothetical protein